ncbi:MAG: DUF2163 domain-containing protein [Rhizobiaceae bacterium]|nr:DUF2163 domain-containing protein [Rhizobiaceae bacterium]
MRKFSTAMSEHLTQRSTTLCTCWILRRRDGQVLGFTDHDQSLQVAGISCQAITGFQPSQAVSELGLSTDNQEIEGVLDSAAISERDLLAGAYDGARIEIWMVNWRSPDQSHLMRVARFGEVIRQDHLFKVQLDGQAEQLNQNHGRSFSRDCDAVLGDARCGVNLTTSAYKSSGEVLQIVDRLTLGCSGLDGFDAGWFAHGQLTWLSGENTGLSVEISSSRSDRDDRLNLWKAMPSAPAIGDTFSITAGCDKSFKTCRSKFANQLRFRGFPHMPGTDFALSYAIQGDRHDGSPLVK